MHTPYFFFHPLLTANRKWAGFECLAQPDHTVASDFVRCLSDPAVAQLAEQHPLILPVTTEWLADPEGDALFRQIKPARAVFAFPESSLDSDTALQTAREIRQRGGHCALRMESAACIKRVSRASFDHLQFAAGFARLQLSPADLSHTRDAGFRRIVSGVDSTETFEWLSIRAVEFADGQFLTLPDRTARAQPDTKRLTLLKLLSLLGEDVDTRKIETLIREDAQLSHKLMRLVNSVAIGARTKVSSFHQAIALLGQRQLLRWVQLLIYANRSTDEPNPLMQLSAARGRQMELLSAQLESPAEISEFADTAFIVGLFSLLDIALKMPMREILDALPLSSTISEALGERKGVLGELLTAVIAGESGNVGLAQTTLMRLAIDPASHTTAQAVAYDWAANIQV